MKITILTIKALKLKKSHFTLQETQATCKWSGMISIYLSFRWSSMVRVTWWITNLNISLTIIFLTNFTYKAVVFMIPYIYWNSSHKMIALRLDFLSMNAFKKPKAKLEITSFVSKILPRPFFSKGTTNWSTKLKPAILLKDHFRLAKKLHSSSEGQ